MSDKSFNLFIFILHFLPLLMIFSPFIYLIRVLFIFCLCRTLLCLRVCGGTLVLYSGLRPFQMFLVDAIRTQIPLKTNFYYFSFIFISWFVQDFVCLWECGGTLVLMSNLLPIFQVIDSTALFTLIR